jgi:hypothetical protein
MPKDTTGLRHADYVYGMRGAATNRLLAAQSQPTAQPSRAERRADMTKFRTERFREAQKLARIQDAAAAFKAAPRTEPKRVTTPTPRPMDLHGRELCNQTLAAIAARPDATQAVAGTGAARPARTAAKVEVRVLPRHAR